MCGIVGYIGKTPSKVLIDKLKKLEYRGYDSAGIAVGGIGGIRLYKAVGEINNLARTVVHAKDATFGIGHTRWATHGRPDETNAHPHVSSDNMWAVVHNGIIENYNTLKEKLAQKGYAFYSETDTETIAKLLEYYYDGDCLTAVNKTVSAVKGSFALGIINSERDGIFFAKNKSPLFIAKNGENVMLASDIICFKDFAEEYYAISDGMYGYADKNGIKFYDSIGATDIRPSSLDLKEYDELNKYKHFCLKKYTKRRQR